MSTYKLVILPSARGGAVGIERKIKTIQAVAVDGVNAKEAIAGVYDDAGETPPKGSPRIVIKNWMRSIQKALDAGDQHVIDLCVRHGIVTSDDGAAPKPAPKAAPIRIPTKK